MVVSFEINPNLLKIIREGYTTLDWFSDVGGLHDIVISIVGLILGFFHRDRFENYLVSKLYKTERTHEELRKYKRKQS